MSFETYNVYFSGNIMQGQDPEEVRKKIGAMFKLEGSKLERLFIGQPVTIKKDVDMDQAVKYRVAFRDAGALVDIRPAEAAQSVPASSPTQNKEPDTQEALTLSPPNSFDLSDCAVPVPPQEIPDISGLTLDKSGGMLDKSSPAEPLEIDTAELELDKPGVTLEQVTPQTPTEFDTSELELNPANQGSLKEYQQTAEPAPQPNIDHLDLAEPDEKPIGNAGFKPRKSS